MLVELSESDGVAAQVIRFAQRKEVTDKDNAVAPEHHEAIGSV